MKTASSDSRYFQTAEKMDQALMELLSRKDLQFITVKEICAEAGVNRSTFYLHYGTIGDLLSECVEMINRQFVDHMAVPSEDVATAINEAPLDKLKFVTADYLIPYLEYIKTNKRLFKTAIENYSALQMDRSYSALRKHIFIPVLDRFNVAEAERKYLLAFYLNGFMAIITEWLEGDCEDSIECISDLMERYAFGK